MDYTTVEVSQRGRLRDLETPGAGEYLDFFYIPPEITENITPEWQDIVVIGRSSPIHAYGSTGARSISLELNFVAESDAYKEVFQKVQWIQSLKYPEYRGKHLKPPHKISLIIGGFISLDGIVKSAEVTWKAPYDSVTKYPMFATVNLTLEESVDVPYGYQQVRNAVRIGYGDLEDAGGVTSEAFGGGEFASLSGF